MVSKYVRALALRVVYHIHQKLPHLHEQPTRTLVMMISAFLAAGGPGLSQMGRQLVDLPGSLQEKVKRMSRFLCQSRFEVHEAFAEYGRRILETIVHAHPQRMIALAWDWTDLGDFMGLWLSIPYQGRALRAGCWVLEKAFSGGVASKALFGPPTRPLGEALHAFGSKLQARRLLGIPCDVGLDKCKDM